MALSKLVVELAKAHRVNLCFAESLTGGSLASAIVSVPGASEVFLGGIVAYQNVAKTDLLQVSTELIERHGVVSVEVARAMAQGGLKLFKLPSDLSVISVATTGVAGPDAQNGVPAGTFVVALAVDDFEMADEFQVNGSREEVRAAAVSSALSMLKDYFEQK
jgi:PncC family amidohydrolase